MWKLRRPNFAFNFTVDVSQHSYVRSYPPHLSPSFPPSIKLQPTSFSLCTAFPSLSCPLPPRDLGPIRRHRPLSFFPLKFALSSPRKSPRVWITSSQSRGRPFPTPTPIPTCSNSSTLDCLIPAITSSEPFCRMVSAHVFVLSEVNTGEIVL